GNEDIAAAVCVDDVDSAPLCDIDELPPVRRPVRGVAVAGDHAGESGPVRVDGPNAAASEHRTTVEGDLPAIRRPSRSAWSAERRDRPLSSRVDVYALQCRGPKACTAFDECDRAPVR